MLGGPFPTSWFVGLLTASVILVPFVGWEPAGTIALFGVFNAAAAVLRSIGSFVFRVLGLPESNPSEPYIKLLKRWQADRRDPADGSSSTPPTP